jgi:multiple RNA-binding domain-containing protein 1
MKSKVFERVMTTPAATTATAAAASSAPATTTRICIINLHPSFDETKLKSHLRTAQPALLITDCKLLKTKDGRSRKIAFVGFQTSSQAETAVSYFDGSFAGTARLSVSLAFSTKKKPQPSEYRPWSKYSVGSSRNEKLQRKMLQQQEKEQQSLQGKKNYKAKLDGGPGEVDNLNVGESDEAIRKREEFLSAMGIATSGKQGKFSKSKFWANDDAGADQTIIARPDDVTEDDMKSSESDDGSDGSAGSSSSSLDSKSDDGATDDVVDKKGEKERISSDLEFLRSKQVEADTLADESDDEVNADDNDSDSSSAPDDSSTDSNSSSGDENENTDKSTGGENAALQGTSDVLESSINSGEKTDPVNSHQLNSTLVDRLFIRNLPFTTTEEDLFEKFYEFGSVTSVHIPVDDSKRKKGYAFVNFERKDDAKLAMDTMDGEDFQGRLIHILPSRPAADKTNDVDGSDLTYKERQDLARQKEAEKSSKGWSASFLRGDAVVDNLSDRLGISKGDILNVKDGISSGNAAVRLALGETHIISENIAFFEDHGVDVVALEVQSNKKDGGGGAPTRSKTMILVKNLPYDTSLEDLTKVFHDIGGDVPQKILLPPSKTAALVEYGHATDARRAFRKLAYKKFKHVPLYLEWASMKTGGKQIPPSEDNTVDAPNQGSSDFLVKPGLLEEDPSMETANTGLSQTVYVKNLNFATNEDQLEQAFARAGIQPRAVKIPTKAVPMKRHGASPAADSSAGNNDVRRLSMGFGFVEFPSEAEALKAMKTLQGKVVDGHALELKLSTKSLSSTKSPVIDKPSNNTKIMIRNVPFESTRTELLQLFGSFGQLKKVRLPKKFDGTHRGFAFCEFVTSKEAQNAMTTLSRTHLYGRHLVLEWAQAADEDGNGKVDVGAIREKTKRDAMRAGLGGTGKKGKHLKF